MSAGRGRPAATAGICEPSTLTRRRFEAPLLARKAYDEAKRLYETADAALRKGVPPAEARAKVERAIEAAQRAGRAAVQVRALFGETLSERAALLQIDPVIAAAAEPADRLLREATARAEAGDHLGARRIVEQMTVELAQAGAAVLRRKSSPRRAESLEQVRGDAPGDAIAAAFRELNAAATSLADRRLGITEVIAVDKRLDELIIKLFPAFFRNPPMTLSIDGFTLFVENYEKRSWDFKNTAHHRSQRDRMVVFPLWSKFVHPFPLIVNGHKDVSRRRDRARRHSEMSAESARRLAPGRKAGETLELRIPKSATTGFEIAQALEELVAVEIKPKGDIRVRFENLTIVPGAVPGTGIVLGGASRLPTTPPPPRGHDCGSPVSPSSSNIWS